MFETLTSEKHPESTSKILFKFRWHADRYSSVGWPVFRASDLCTLPCLHENERRLRLHEDRWRHAIPMRIGNILCPPRVNRKPFCLNLSPLRHSQGTREGPGPTNCEAPILIAALRSKPPASWRVRGLKYPVTACIRQRGISVDARVFAMVPKAKAQKV